MPKTRNFTAIDAWIPGVGAFQMTVGKSHDIKPGAADIWSECEQVVPNACEFRLQLRRLYLVTYQYKAILLSRLEMDIYS